MFKKMIFWVFLAPVFADSQILNLGEISDVIELNGEPQNLKRFYKIQIQNKVSDDDTLIVKVMTDDPFSDPNIFMSFSQQEPNENSEYKCAAAGKDTCTISGVDLQRKKQVYVTVYCQKQCRYQIHSSIQKIVELTDNTELQLDFSPDESKLFKVKVPSVSELGGVQKDRITSLTILAAPLIQSATQNQADLILSATTDQKRSPSTNDIQGVPVWTQGKAIHLTEESVDGNRLCTDCWVKILLSVTKEGRYTIISKANTGEAQRAFEGKVIYGVSQPGERTCFKYHIQDSIKNLDVRFKLYSGSASQTIDPMEMPDQWNSSKFKFSGAFDSEYVISNRMRQQVGHEDGLYYICNFAHTLTSFSTIIQEVDPEQDFTELENGFTYTQEIERDKHSFIYQVPKLDYVNEDIKISFYMEVLDGPLPKMAVRYCNKYQDQDSDQALAKCGKEIAQLTADDVIQRSKSTNDEMKFFWAKPESGINVLQIDLDHNEEMCNSQASDGKQQKTKCFYQVVILADGHHLTKYSLSATRFQKNYELLRGSLPKIASVAMDEVRYFKFSLSSKTNYKTVSFQLKTFHGDADLFVSRDDQWPSGRQGDRASTGEIIDRVDFTKNLKGEYYVGVKGYMDSTFEIKVVLQTQDEDEWKLMEGNQLDRNYQLLIDGYPKEAELHNEGDQHKYRLVVDMEKGFEKSIKIDVINRQQDYNVKVFINFKREPNILAKNDIEYFGEGDKHIEIPVGSEFYHSKGTYYILIMPQNDLVNSIFRYYFEDDYYRYQIKYTLEGTFEFLGPGILTQSRQGANTRRFYRYIVEDRNIDQRISLNMYEGTSAIKTDFQMDAVKMVDTSNHDGRIIYEGQTSTLIMSKESLKEQCADEFNPCIIYIGVQCVTQGHSLCQFSLKITDPNAGPEKLIVGTPIQDNVEKDEINYYYIVVTEEHVKEEKQINVVLNTIIGDADLYVKMQQNQNLIKRKDWVLPTQIDYDAKSELVVKQDITNIPSKLLKNCIKKSKLTDTFKKLSGKNEQAQCAILIGVKGKLEAVTSQYNLVAYVNLQILQSDRAAYGQVEENSYQYFTYQVNCDKCEVIIGVQDYSGGDPDLYINFGQDNLPDKEKFDFKSTSFTSEIFILNLSDEYFKRHKIPSMKGTYSIGVYGKKSSSFEITATQNENRIITLMDSYRNKQNAYQTVFYKWFHAQAEDQRNDVQMQITVNSGKVDVYVNNYDHDFEQQNMVDRLPDSARKAFYTLPGIRPTSSSGEGQLIIQAADANYCSNCWILIGVHSRDQESDYEVSVQSLKADFQNSHFIKMGSPERTSVAPGSSEIFKFIIDEKEDVTISTTNHKGQTTTFVNSEPSIDQAIDSYANDGYAELEVKNQIYKTGVLYFVVVKNVGSEEADFTISINQDNSVIEIQNGVPLQVKFIDDQDMTKNFALPLPKGKSTLTIQLQPLYQVGQSKFEPFLYYKIVNNLGEVKDSIDFPPSGSGFGIKRNYEGNGFLQLSKVINIDSDDGGLLFNIYMAPNRRAKKDDEARDVMVFVSTQNEKLLSENQLMLESMFKNEQIEYIKLDEAFTQYQTGYTIIETSTCLGLTKTSFLTDPEDQKSSIRGYNYYDDKSGGRYVVSFKNPIPNFYTVVESIQLSDKKMTAFRDGQGNRAQFMIKAYQSANVVSQGTVHKLSPKSSDLRYQQSESSPNIISLKWETLPYTEVEYWVIVSMDTDANLESACVMNQDVYQTNNYRRYMTVEGHYDIAMIRGKDTKINVAARVLDGENRGEIFVYHQILVNLPKEKAQIEESGGKSLSLLFVLIFLITAGSVGYLIIYKRHLFNFKTKPRAQEVQHHELGQYSISSEVDYNPPSAYNLDDSVISEEKYNIQ